MTKIMNMFLNFGCSNGLVLSSVMGTSSEGGLETFLNAVVATLSNILELVYNFIVQLIWLIMQFMLLLIDFVFVFVRQITGINVDFSDISSLEESDILFQFLLSDAVMDVVKGILVLAVVLVIVFAIISIIKNEYAAATTGANNAKGQILSSTLKSLFMMILVPVIVIGSVFLSNALLAALYNATSGGDDVSMGTQVFMASTYQANVFRDYADSGQRIPITYDFSEVNDRDNIGEWANGDTIAETEEAYLAFRNQSVWERGLSTYLMFANGFYETIDYIEEADAAAIAAGDDVGSAFHLSYDEGLFYKKYEYYQMAEAIDYAMKHGKELYFKTPHDIMKSWDGCSVSSKYLGLFSGYEDDLSFSIKYSNEENATIYHSKYTGSTQDEATGSVFLVCVRQTDSNNGKDYFVPVIAGYDFFSSYIDGNSVVVAKGLFDDGKYPTAIREVNNEVECYRDKVNAPYFADIFPKISYELPEGTTQHPASWILHEGLSFVTGVDVDEYIPYLYYNFDIFNLFGKSSRTIVSLDAGGFNLSYAFNDGNVGYTNFFSFTKTNIVILVFCTIILLSMLFKAVFGVTARIFDIVLLWISYPAVCATMSMDGGSRFKKWTETFVQKLLYVYSLVLGINIVLLLFPVIESVNVFSNSQISDLAARGMIPDWSGDFVNMLLRWLMIFVAFGSIETIVNVLSQILGFKIKNVYGREKGKIKRSGDSSVIGRGDEVLAGAKEFSGSAIKLISGKFIVDGIKEVGKDAAGLIPTGALWKNGAEAKRNWEAKKGVENEMKTFENDIRTGNVGNFGAQADKVNKSMKNYENVSKKK